MTIIDTRWGKIGHGRCLPNGTYHTRNLHGLVLSIFRESEPAPNGRGMRWQWRVVVDGKEYGAFHTLKSAKYAAEQNANQLTSNSAAL